MIDTKQISWWPELEKIIEQEIRPSLQLDGDIRLVDFNPANWSFKCGISRTLRWLSNDGIYSQRGS